MQDKHLQEKYQTIVNPVVLISKPVLSAYFSQLYFFKVFFASMMQFTFIIRPFFTVFILDCIEEAPKITSPDLVISE